MTLFNMSTEMILACSCVATVITIVSNAFVDRINMSLKISLLCSLVITFWTRVPVNPMNLTDMLEQVTLFVGAEITLIALNFFVSVDVLDVGFQVRGERCFKLAGGEGALVHGALLEALSPLLDLHAGIKHCVHVPRAGAVILKKMLQLTRFIEYKFVIYYTCQPAHSLSRWD